MALLRLAGRNRDGDMQADCIKRKASGILLPSRGKHGDGRAAGGLRAGDTVLARLDWNEEGDHFTARLIRKLSRQHSGERPLITALYHRKHKTGDGFLEPVDKRERQNHGIRVIQTDKAQDGDLVSAEIISQGRYAERQAKITANHGPLNLCGGLSLIAAAEQGLPLSFSPQALQEAEALQPITLTANGAQNAQGDKSARLDLRHIPFITIDPADARDHDDAVWAQADADKHNPDGWIVLVAIADVAAYVACDSALDRDARERGNSTYFPDGVLPMLPERLSADLCSLRAGEERPCLVARMVFDQDGRRRAHSFSRAMIKSAAALAYEQAQAAMDGAEDAVAAVGEDLLRTSLRPLWGAYRALSKARQQRQPLELEMPEYHIRLDESGRLTEVQPVPRLDAHRLIEEFMIAANSALARELAGKTLIHRVHEPPGSGKIEELGAFLQALNLQSGLRSNPKPKDFNAILQTIKKEDMRSILGEAILRSQSQAFYATSPLGHFGLQLRHYAHFTSPIRRYADLAVHRALLAHLRGEKTKPEQAQEASATAEHISITERRSVTAERDTNARYMSLWLRRHIGETRAARIVGISKAGLFIRPHGSAADGFAPAARLPGGFFRFEPKRFAMVARNGKSGRIYQVGDEVSVRIAEADALTGSLILDVIPDARPRKKR